VAEAGHWVAAPRAARRLTLTPLVDVVFLLLLFFMLETDFLQPRSVRLVLPGATAAGSADREALRLELQAGGIVWIGGERVGRKGLPGRLAALAPAPDRAVLAVDDAVEVQTVVDVLDVLDAASIGAVSLQRAPRFD